MSNYNFESKEHVVREHRTAEAVRKNYVGGDGKPARIARALGSPVVNQSGDFNPWEDADPFSLPTLDEDDTSCVIGWHFDGLRGGVGLEIRHLEFEQKIQIWDRGRLVYAACDRDLECFVPGEWEERLEKLFEQTKRVECRRRGDARYAEAVEAKQASLGFLARMREKWGL